MLKEGKKEKIIGLVILLVVIVGAIGFKLYLDSKSDKNLNVIYGAVGGGKEDFLADPDFNKILKDKYKIKFVGDSWGNGSTIKLPLVRESVHLGNTNIPTSQLSVNNKQCSQYDLLFTSDERYLTYYRTEPVGEEAERNRVLKGSLTLNTPIVFYSWDVVTNALIKEGIVEERDGVYYMTNPKKMLNYMLQGKKWKDIGLNFSGNITILSVDPTLSSPGATYYGLLLNILTDQEPEDQAKVERALPTLKKIYDNNGYSVVSPADLFDGFMKLGVNSYPIIVDYEKSIMEFINKDKKFGTNNYEQVKDRLRIIYSDPTITNSHCIATFNDNGNAFLDAFEDKDIKDIAWARYGFRVGIASGVNIDKIKELGVTGIPRDLPSGARSLKMETYNRMVEYLEKGV